MTSKHKDMKIYKKKKDIPDERKVRRLKFIVAVIAVMAAVAYIPRCGDKGTSPVDETTAAMDAALDSMITSMGFDSYEVTSRGEPQRRAAVAAAEQKDSLGVLSRFLEFAQTMTGIDEAARDSIIGETTALVDRLTERIAAIEAGTPPADYYTRRIRFTAADGRRYTFFQRYHPLDGTMSAAYFTESVFDTTAATQQDTTEQR